jgi:hypothetical protein
MNELRLTGKLVDTQNMLNEVFSDGWRPSLRWLRTQTKAGAVPHIRTGHLVFCDVEMVRTHLVGTRLVRGRYRIETVRRFELKRSEAEGWVVELMGRMGYLGSAVGGSGGLGASSGFLSGS